MGRLFSKYETNDLETIGYACGYRNHSH